MPKGSGGGGSGGRSGGGGGGGSGATTKTLMIGGVVIKKGLTSSQLDEIWIASGARGGTPQYGEHMRKISTAFKAAGIKAEDYEPDTRYRAKINRLYRDYG